MAAKSTGYRKLSGAEQRALAEQLATAQVDHIERAKSREMAMVANLGRFADECRWFMANKVWLTLGYETFVEWWADRITPVVETLGLTPGPELAQMAIEAIRKEEEGLPAAQRHTKKAIASIVGVGEWKVRGRQDQRQRRPTAGADLENAAGVIDGELVAEKAALVDGMRAAIESAEENQKNAQNSTGGAPVDGKPGATGSSAGPVDVSRLDGSGTPNSPADQTPPSDTAEEPLDLARAGDTGGQPEQAHRDAIPGEAEDEGPTGGESSDAADVRASAAQTEVEVPTPVDPSVSVNGRQQQGGTGVSGPAAAVPEWLVRVSAVIAAVDELAKEDPAEVGQFIGEVFGHDLGATYDLFHDWYLRMRDATP